MKKKSVIIAIVLIAVLIGTYAVFDSIFPRAAAITVPNKENVTAITLIRDDGSSVTADEAEHEQFLQDIAKARPTRRMSVNDRPYAKNCYIIKIDEPGREYRYFIYMDGHRAYIEIPYEGVYRTDKAFFELVEGYFKN